MHQTGPEVCKALFSTEKPSIIDVQNYYNFKKRQICE